jgi:hypothetical protein
MKAGLGGDFLINWRFQEESSAAEELKIQFAEERAPLSPLRHS